MNSTSKLSVQEIVRRTGMTQRSVQRHLSNENPPFEVLDGRKLYCLSTLPLGLQSALIGSSSSQGEEMQEDIFADPRVIEIGQIVREAEQVPDGWQNKAWKQAVAHKHGVHIATLYDWVGKFRRGGLEALAHRKKNRGQPKKWHPEAIDFGVGLALRRSNRKLTQKEIYNALATEAIKKNWAIGCYRSFTEHLRRRLNPQLLALRDGGRRGLDNVLPPILRSYADLEPFEIIVGDQHRHDCWVRDDSTGQPFRPESYFLLDLRTRLIYGFWAGKKYDGYSIGLAMRVGSLHFGAFKAFYSDNGKPELSKYVDGIVDQMASLGLAVEETPDVPCDFSDVEDPEEIACSVQVPGNHRRAIVRNAKAKLIERFFSGFEDLLRNRFRVPGQVKSLSASGEVQEVDEAEIKGLANSGGLLRFTEFVQTLIQAADFYNKQRPHRGVLAEWKARPRPAEVTPMQCLKSCIEDEGWKPTWLSIDAINLLFLAKEKRIVGCGRIRFKTYLTDLYEHEELAELHGQEVTIRFDPLDPAWVLVFSGTRFVCKAVPVEYSSMKDSELAKRKIEQKGHFRKRYLEEYSQLTSKVPDLIQYSSAPVLEAVARTVRENIQIENSKVERTYSGVSEEQLAAEIRQREDYEASLTDAAAGNQSGVLSQEQHRVECQSDVKPVVTVSPESRKRPVFEYPVERYRFLLDEVQRGCTLSRQELLFVAGFEAGMAADVHDFWAIHKEICGISDQLASALAEVSSQAGVEW